MMEEVSPQQKPDDPKPKKIPPKLEVKDLLIAFLMPMLVGKVAVLYFGIAYSAYPDRGYGYGLLISVLWTVGALIRFVWKFRDYEDM